MTQFLTKIVYFKNYSYILISFDRRKVCQLVIRCVTEERSGCKLLVRKKD